MKILHTADWHLGHRLHEQSQQEEQAAFLNWLHQYIDAAGIDILMVSGDVFDTGVPSTQSQRLYYDFLINLRNTNCKHIVITGGNHDAPGTLNAPKDLLAALSIHVVGKAPEEVADEVFDFEVNGEKVVIGAVPYLRDQDIRKAVAGESFEEIGERYKQALVNHYTDVANYIEQNYSAEIPAIGMGHLFAIGGSTSDSEQTIYVGNLGDIGADDFPKRFDYLALGHLHRPQSIGGNDMIRYSGSPNILSFSEVGYEKQVLVLHINDQKITEVEKVLIPKFRSLIRLSGPLDEVIEQLNEIDKITHQFVPWVEVQLTEDTVGLGFSSINKAAEDLNLEVLKVTLKQAAERIGIDTNAEAVDLKELSPMAVFKMKCEEEEFDLNENQEIYDAFCEALDLAKGGGEA
ncbi:exonuclease SbcCD subunit D C-terminal domain-containing protein [Crocinitomix catalasitica]|uniref:exonuclease SbcCD subunit D C-terminal domain-containing protein n=1 Tax=Crocinitomix catalasitica TaxID=184607 RepID=UPI00047F1450|nr:exonuclease SbcCD subunit D C-terminal domain-containing protein [Crocinitomix catalasitica]